ncbi:S-layer homology domain-containing protein [Peribacillus acanthi]|uniref:S-layer homology domain-containing protein n=1 Tax=Peribacillus acanthi TaxID=2171554 RepID=UPI000D3EBAF7|nr:S-layer homology domain-containing protein [Peribacillus acanthi]
MRKVAASLLVFLLFAFVSQIQAQSYSDIDSHWGKKEIEALIDEGVVSGFEDGTFRPYTQVTRGQFLAFLVRALDLPAGDSTFPDVPSTSRLYTDISAAKKAGLILGNQDGLALADNPVTRSDVAVMLDRAMHLKGDYTERQTLTFKDSRLIGKYAYEAVERMTYYGLISGTADNNFAPTKIASRGESAVLIYRMMDKLNLLGEDTTSNPDVNQEVVIKVNDHQDIKVRMNTKGVPITYSKSSTVKHILSTDYHYYYHLGSAAKPTGTLQVTLRKMDNGDTFVFTKFIHNGDTTYNASVILPFQNSDNYSVATYASQGTIDKKPNGTFGEDHTSHPIGIFSAKSGDSITNEVMLGKNYVSTVRETRYDNGHRSIIRELIEERESYQVIEDKTTKVITANLNISVRGKAVSESWALLSEKPLFSNEEKRNQWFKRTINEYRAINNWLTAEGAYTKLPYSIEPSYQKGYGRNIGRIQGGVYLTAYQDNKERYFHNLVINALADLDVLSDGALSAGENPIFKTEYTSTWLKKPYGITAPYIDTRLNENAALFLKNSSETLNIPQLSKANLRYADFLVEQKALGNIIPVTASSHLISDYFGLNGQTTKTHVSLNHALGEMRFLLESYKQTNDVKYFTTAKQIKVAIEKLHPKWIRTNGDLWYSVNSEFTFTGNDYENLTLMDLLLSQNIFAETGIPRSKEFDEMVRSKTKYLVENNLGIIPPIVQLLQEQGFGDLLPGTYKASSIKESNEKLPEDELDQLAK